MIKTTEDAVKTVRQLAFLTCDPHSETVWQFQNDICQFIRKQHNSQDELITQLQQAVEQLQVAFTDHNQALGEATENPDWITFDE